MACFCILFYIRHLYECMFVKKYYPCGKFYFHGYENRFSCPCVSIWTNGYFLKNEQKELGLITIFALYKSF